MIRLALLFLLARPCSATPSFNKEAGVRLSSAVIQATAGAYPTLRAYYIQGGSRVYSATTADGLTFSQEAGVRLSSSTAPVLDIAISSITGLSVLPLTGGGYRMLYSVIGTTGAYRIYSATSTDGLSWANDTGTQVNVNGGLTFAGFPSLVKLGTGDWRLYYIQNSVAGNQPANYQIFSALSTDQGRNFGAGSAVLASQAGEVASAALTNGRVRLYYTAAVVGQSSNTTVLSALSTDSGGSSFTSEFGVRLSTGSGLGSIASPFVTRSSDTYGWRLYYDYIPPSMSTGDAYSALADSPDIQGLAPSVVYRADPPSQLTITGEVFSPAPTAKLSLSGQPDIVGASLTRVNDQTITVTFNTQNQSLGAWNLTVTNANGLSGVSSGALLIDFRGGETHLTDNLLRPRQGLSTKIAVSIFNDGQASVKLYTLRGELVNTIYDGFLTTGTHAFLWNGTTSLGRTVASGVYILQTTGPKLNVTSKIVVVK